MYPHISLRKIAEELNLSRSTVSRALNGHPMVDEETRRRVKESAIAMGYHPDPTLKSVMKSVRSGSGSGCNETIAFILGDVSTWSQFSMDNARRCESGARERANFLGYEFDTFSTKDYTADGKRLGQVLWHRGIHGVIIGQLDRPGTELDLPWGEFCSVSIGYSITNPRIHRVSNHHFHSIRLALENLQRLGYSRIGLLVDRTLDERVDHNWLAGYLLYEQTCAISDRIPPLFVDDYDPGAISDWITRHGPKAIVCPASGKKVMDCLEVAKIRVPQDVAVAALNVTPMYNRIAGVDQRPSLIGALSVNQINAQLAAFEKGLPETPCAHLIEGVWSDGPTAPPCGKKRKR